MTMSNHDGHEAPSGPIMPKYNLSPYPIYAALAIFWVMTYFIDIFDWGQGTNRAIVTAAALIATPVLVRVSSGSKLQDKRNMSIALGMTALIIFAWHLFIFYSGFSSSDRALVDIALRTLDAGKLLLAGKNPYTSAIDGVGRYAGYKYLPMMAIVFLPLGALWGNSGVIATNLILDVAVIVLIIKLGSRIGSLGVGVLAASLYMISTFVPSELFYASSTDLAAVVPLLVALVLVERRPTLAGFFVGLSISTKILPGAVFAICTLPNHGRLRYFLGLAIGMLPILPFFVISPGALVDNAVMWGFVRAFDSTSWMYLQGSSPAYYPLVQIAFASTLLFVAAYVWFRRPNLAQMTGLAVICVMAALLSGTANHRDYQLWWLPFFAVLVAKSAYAISGFGIDMRRQFTTTDRQFPSCTVSQSENKKTAEGRRVVRNQARVGAETGANGNCP
jgi:hypothetical protein